MRTLTCSVFKVPSHSFPGCDFIVAQFEAGPESFVDALCYAYLTHFLGLKRLFKYFQSLDQVAELSLDCFKARFRLFSYDQVIQRRMTVSYTHLTLPTT